MNIRATEDDIKNIDIDIKSKKLRREKLENRVNEIDKNIKEELPLYTAPYDD